MLPNKRMDGLQQSKTEEEEMIPKKYHGYRVVGKDSRALKDYAGMNYYAAKKIGIKHGPGKKTIWLDTRTYEHHPKTLKRNLVHEYVEAETMRKHHCTYWCAHKKALRAEKNVR